MKRSLFLLLIVFLLCLTACREQPVERFFSPETLQQLQLTDLPIPADASGSQLDGSGKLCIDLSDEAYTQYVQEILNYLQTRNDVHYLSYPHSHSIELLFFPYDILAPVEEDYDPTSNDHTFVFSTQAELGERDRLRNPIRIEIRRENGRLEQGFSYNTVLEIKNSRSGEYAPCIARHSYDEGIAYPVPGQTEPVTIRTCIHCNTMEKAPFGDGTQYWIRVSEGEEFLLEETPAYCLSGALCRIRLKITVDHDLILTANGTPIPKTGYGPNYWEYTFLAPKANVQLSITPAEGGPVPPAPDKEYLFFHEPWLRELEAVQIQEIRTVKMPVAVPAHFLSDVHRTTDPAAIQGMLRVYAELKMTRLTREEDAMITGGSRFTVEFILTDGTVYTLLFHNGFYYAQDETIFRVGNPPSLAAFVNVTEASAFATLQESCDVYRYDSETGGPGERIGQFTGLAGMEFTEYLQDIPQDLEVLYCIPCGWGHILVYSDSLFCLQIEGEPQVWYSLTQGTFPEMIKENA